MRESGSQRKSRRERNDPVFPDTGTGVFRGLKMQVFFPCGRRKDFRNKVRGADNTSVRDFVPVTNNQNIRLDNGLIIPGVELYIPGSHIDFTFTFVFPDMIPEHGSQNQKDILMDSIRSGHIIKNTVDQFRAAVCR